MLKESKIKKLYISYTPLFGVRQARAIEPLETVGEIRRSSN